MTSKAVEFMRDNTSGGLVLNAHTTNDGGITYRMDSGIVYRLTPDDVKTLSRYSYKPRFVEKFTKS